MTFASSQGARVVNSVILLRDEFLAGFTLEDAPEFVEWLFSQREKWQQILEELFDRYSSLLVESNEVQKTLGVNQEWLRQEPLNETAGQRLIQTFRLEWG